MLLVTEPTLSGAHDLERVLGLTRHFGIPAAVCVNKVGHQPGDDRTDRGQARSPAPASSARVRYDPRSVPRPGFRKRAVVDTDCPSADDIRGIWKELAIQ